MNVYRIYHLLIVLCSLLIGIKMHLVDLYVSFGIMIECTYYDLFVLDLQLVYMFKVQSLFMLSLIQTFIFNWYMN